MFKMSRRNIGGDPTRLYISSQAIYIEFSELSSIVVRNSGWQKMNRLCTDVSLVSHGDI